MDKEYSRRLENVSKKYESSSVKESGDTIGDVFSSLVMLPMLRGLWTFSCVDNSGNVYDNSFQGRTLTNTSSATFGVTGLVPWAYATGTSYFTRAEEAGLDITSNLSMGCWFYAAAGTTNGTLACKLGTSGSYSYMLDIITSKVRFLISNTGSDTFSSTSTVDIVPERWHHIVGVYVPSTSLTVYLDGVGYTNTTSIPASIFNSSVAFTTHRRQTGTNTITARLAQLFLCASSLTESCVKSSIFSTSRVFLGV